MREIEMIQTSARKDISSRKLITLKYGHKNNYLNYSNVFSDFLSSPYGLSCKFSGKMCSLMNLSYCFSLDKKQSFDKV